MLLPWAVALSFWVPFLVRGRIDKLRGRGEQGKPPVHAHDQAITLVGLHTLAVAMQYGAFALGIHGGARWTFPHQELVGGVVIGLATALATWVLVVFRTWRLRAELSADHQLCTDGPFRFIRHPIYTAMVIGAIGTTLWAPNPAAVCGVVAMFVGGELRARAEEPLLVKAFGDEYRAYQARTKKFVPGIY